MISARWPLVFLLVGIVSTAFAQDKPSPSSITVQAGVPQRIAFYPAAKKDCTRTPLPEIKLIEEPKRGKFIVRRVSIKADPESPCPGQTIPGLLVLFIASQTATGTDSATYEVKAGERSAAIQLTIQIIPGKKLQGAPIDL